MASLYIKDPEANALAERLARQQGVTRTAAVKHALSQELVPLAEAQLHREPVRAVLERFWRDFPPPGPEAPVIGKSFYDELSGEPGD